VEVKVVVTLFINCYPSIGLENKEEDTRGLSSPVGFVIKDIT
jgi:hypothetical protein